MFLGPITVTMTSSSIPISPFSPEFPLERRFGCFRFFTFGLYERVSYSFLDSKHSYQKAIPFCPYKITQTKKFTHLYIQSLSTRFGIANPSNIQYPDFLPIIVLMFNLKRVTPDNPASINEVPLSAYCCMMIFKPFRLSSNSSMNSTSPKPMTLR